MSGTITSVACTIDATGIHAPAFNDVLAYLQAQYQGIYGSDVYLGNDSQDGQLLAVFAKAISDCNNMAVAVFNSFSPSTAQGTGLSSVVKINGIARLVPSNSNVAVTIIGQIGTVINNGIVGDTNSNRWDLPAVVTIPTTGQITVTAVSETPGKISATIGSVTRILTPTRGWQSVSNAAIAFVGAPVESDAALRGRQTISTMLPSLTPLDGIIGAIAAIPGVTRYVAYENATDLTDANGQPPHSLAVVVFGGDIQTVANVIATKKTIGTATFGTTTATFLDQFGVALPIHFFQATRVFITIVINITPLFGYTDAVGADIIQSFITYCNQLSIGEDVILSKLYVPANLTGLESDTFAINSILMCRPGGTPVAANITMAFNEVAAASASGTTLVVGAGLSSTSSGPLVPSS